MELSREARIRLAGMDCYRRCRNVAYTGRHFGISRQTFYRWQRRYDPYDLNTLEERSHCPRRRRQPASRSDTEAAECMQQAKRKTVRAVAPRGRAVETIEEKIPPRGGIFSSLESANNKGVPSTFPPPRLRLLDWFRI